MIDHYGVSINFVKRLGATVKQLLDMKGAVVFIVVYIGLIVINVG